MKFCVDMRIGASYTAYVDADSPEEAETKAQDMINDADFGEAENIEHEIIGVGFNLDFFKREEKKNEN